MILSHLSEAIGSTPMVCLSGFAAAQGLDAQIAAKCEFFNPLSSAKDRAALYMIRGAMERGELRPGMIIVEPTSGNTGVGLAYIAKHFGFPVVLTMPESMSVERRKLLAALGAELVLTEASRGMAGAVEAAQEIAKTRGGYIPDQFANPDNARAHFETTGPEIWRDCIASGWQPAAFVAAFGTGGTITGVGRYLKQQDPEIRIVAVEPEDSPLLSQGHAGAHKIQGIGANFIPSLLDRDIIDQVETAGTQESFAAARLAAREDGVFAGISSGAALAVAARLARLPEFCGKQILTLLPDTGERYLSTDLYEV